MNRTVKREYSCLVLDLRGKMLNPSLLTTPEFPWIEEPGRLQSMDSKSTRHD